MHHSDVALGYIVLSISQKMLLEFYSASRHSDWQTDFWILLSHDSENSSSRYQEALPNELRWYLDLQHHRLRRDRCCWEVEIYQEGQPWLLLTLLGITWPEHDASNLCSYSSYYFEFLVLESIQYYWHAYSQNHNAWDQVSFIDAAIAFAFLRMAYMQNCSIVCSSRRSLILICYLYLKIFYFSQDVVTSFPKWLLWWNSKVISMLCFHSLNLGWCFCSKF